MAEIKSLQDSNGNDIIKDGKINYEFIDGVPSSVTDVSNHNHDDLYTSKVTIENEFTNIMNEVQQLSKAQTSRPLKTKGFLNGGYKKGHVHAQRVQRFNTITETGTEIAQGFVTSYYTPGGSSELKGYFFGTKTSGTTRSDNPRTGREVDNIVYLTEVETYLGSLITHNVKATLYNLYSQNKLYACNNDKTATGKWTSIDVVSDTATIRANTPSQGITRQGLSSETFGLVIGSTNTSTKYTYLTEVSSTGETHTRRQVTTGLSKDADVGYWIDYGTAHNYRIDFKTMAPTQINCFTEGFGESNALGSEKYGFMMGGYDGKQHGKVQKMTWSTEAASNVLGGSLSIPQSSAGMAEA